VSLQRFDMAQADIILAILRQYRVPESVIQRLAERYLLRDYATFCNEINFNTLRNNIGHVIYVKVNRKIHRRWHGTHNWACCLRAKRGW
jgi:hypothetical protein